MHPTTAISPGPHTLQAETDSVAAQLIPVRQSELELVCFVVFGIAVLFLGSGLLFLGDALHGFGF